MARLWLWTAVLLGLGYVLVRGAVQPVDTYIYYHEPRRGIIVERVDGRDRRVLVPLSMIKDRVNGLRWAPGGDWLAWETVAYRNRPLVDEASRELWLTSRDGSRHVLIESGATLQDWAWSPRHDLLLIQTEVATVYDAARQVEIVTFADLPGPATWTPDGRHLAIQARAAERLEVLGLDGARHVRYPTGGHVTWLEDGSALYWQAGQLRREDFVTETTITHDLPPPPAGYVPSWSPDGRYALLTAHNPPDRTRIWLLDVEAERLILVENTGAAYYGIPQWTPRGPYMGGMDGAAYRVNLHSAQLEPLPLPVDANWASYYSRPPAIEWQDGYVIWYGRHYRAEGGALVALNWGREDRVAPNGAYRVVFTCGVQPQTCLLETATGQAVTLPPVPDRMPIGHEADWHWPWVRTSELTLSVYNVRVHRVVLADGRWQRLVAVAPYDEPAFDWLAE